MSFAVRAAVAASRCLVENLEDRRLLAGQVFAGAGPVVGGNAGAVLAADFNGDGKIDLVTTPAAYTSAAQPLSVTLGDGAGAFNAVSYNAPALQVTAATSGDFNGDGRADLIVSRQNSIVGVLPGNATGALVVTANYGVSGPITALGGGDFNNDGKLDLLLASGAGSLTVRAGNGDATFSTATSPATVTTQTGVYAASMAVADYNGDNKLDVALANPDSTNGSINVLFGDGTGAFSAPVVYAAGSSPRGIVAADFNNDGRPDLAATNYHNNTVSLLLNTGNGAFGATVSVPAGINPGLIVTSDFNNDGRPDVAVSSNTSMATVLLGNGTGLVSGASVTLGLTLGSLTTADFNADGRADLAAVSANASVNTSGGYGLSTSVVLGDGSGVFTASTNAPTVATGTFPLAAATGDFDHDGNLDVAVPSPTDRSVSFLRGGGDGTLTPAGTTALTTRPQAIVAVDLNGDGHLDLATANPNTADVSILLGNGDGTFTPTASPVAVGQGPVSIVVGDFTGDNRPDLVIANNSQSYLTLLRNLGNGAFARQDVPLGGFGSDTLTAGDFNNDNTLDLAATITAGFNATQIAVLKNDGVGGFTPLTNLPFPMGTGTAGPRYGLAAVDLNADGKTDLAFASAGQATLTHFVNNGNGTFTGTVGGRIGSNNTQLSVADFTGDGRPDLAAASAYNGTGTNALTLLRGRADGGFDSDGVYIANSASYAVPGDFNNDGKPDLVAVSPNANGVTVLLNRRPDAANVTAANGVLRVTPAAGQPTTITRSGDTLTIATASGVETRTLAGIRRIVIAGNTATLGNDLGAAGGAIALQIDSGATAVLTASQHLASLTIDGTLVLAANGNRVLRTASLTLGATGVLDLNDNAMVYDYNGPSPQQATIRDLIRTARAGGAWTGVGLTSTAARQDAAGRTTLGYLESTDFKSLYGNTAAFAGETVDDTAVLVRYTLYGDTDLDTGVSINDFNRLSAAFGTPTAGTWLSGDLDADGGVSINDFNLLSANFGKNLLAVTTPTTPAVKKGVAPAKR